MKEKNRRDSKKKSTFNKSNKPHEEKKEQAYISNFRNEKGIF